MFQPYMVRADDGPIGLKHVALNVLLIVITDGLDEHINTLLKMVSSSMSYCCLR